MKKIIPYASILTVFSPVTFADWKIINCPNGNCLRAWVDAIKQYIANAGLIADKPLSIAIQDIIQYFLSFLSLIAVIYIMWAGAQMLLFPANENSSEKTKKIIISVIVGLTLIWFAWWIVNSLFFVLGGSWVSTN